MSLAPMGGSPMDQMFAQAMMNAYGGDLSGKTKKDKKKKDKKKKKKK